MLLLLATSALCAPLTGKNTLILWYSMWGSTKRVADTLAAETGGTLLEIRADTDYSGFLGLFRSARDWLVGRDFKVLTPLPDLTPYEYIFVLSPVWGWRPVPHVSAFLDKLDFGGRSVIPVGICRSNMKGFVAETAKHLTNAKLIEKDGFYMVASLAEDKLKENVRNWLVGI
jgi:flavodoxin